MSDQTSPDAPATHIQIIRIASRLFAAFLLFWVIDDLTALPIEILNLAHEMRTAAIAGAPWSAFAASYYLRYSILGLLSNLLRMTLWLVAAGWFYRCGPRIQRFFSPETADSYLAPISNPEP